MAKTGERVFVCGEYWDIHQCDSCETILDEGQPYIYWPHRDLTLCRTCLYQLVIGEGRTRTSHIAGTSPKRRIPLELREDVFVRDDYRCRYCGSRRRLTIDHVFPECRGGRDTLNNLVTACKSCNSAKGPRTPAEAGMRLLPLTNTRG